MTNQVDKEQFYAKAQMDSIVSKFVDGWSIASIERDHGMDEDCDAGEVEEIIRKFCMQHHKLTKHRAEVFTKD